jgi:hypothetical protein
MLPLFRRLFVAFFLDELAFRRWMRGGLFAFAGGGLAFAEQIAGILEVPNAVKWVKAASVVAVFVAGSSRAPPRRPPTPLSRSSHTSPLV